MEKKTALLKVIYLGVVLCLMTSMSIFDSIQGAPITSGPRYGGTLRVGEQYEGVSIGYPPKLARAQSNRQAAPAVETLFRNDKTGKPVPWLATGFTGDIAAKTITLSLSKGVKFHDGTDFNAEAVKWNLGQSMSVRSPGTEKFRSIDVIDDSTVRINLTDWDNTVTSNLALTLGMMISPTAYKKNGEEWCSKNPVGTGPFQFVSWERDVRVTYKKFDGYWQKGKPYIDRIEFTLIPEPLTREFSFRRGDLDLVMTTIAKEVAGLKKDGFMVTGHTLGGGVRSLVPDSANPKSPFFDVRVRQAAQHAIDTEALVKTIYYGLTEPTNQYIYKGHWAYNPAVVGYPYSPEKAKKLLTEAGYSNGFKTKILYRTDPQSDQLYTAIQGYLKAVGIDAELDPALPTGFDRIAWQGGKWEGLIEAPISPNPDLAATLAWRYSGGGKFFTQMLLPDDYLRAIQNAITAPDFETKQKYTQEALKLMIDKYCLMIVQFGLSEFAVSKAHVHNHGYCETPTTNLGTPEDTWLER